MISVEEVYKKIGFTKYRDLNHLPYPINVVRNVARLSSMTKHVLASDIELYPSVGIVSDFMKMLEREKQGEFTKLVSPGTPHVYVLPIFEVKAGLSAPKTKSELVQMAAKGWLLMPYIFVYNERLIIFPV